jgi:dissimilatory sulfite reductase (desulfoviridin) alpha/beta subunit
MSKHFKLKNGTLFLSTEAPGGVYNSQQLKKIAEISNQDLAIVKATEDQRIGLFVKEDEYETVVAQLKDVGLGFRNYQDGLHQPVSCIGELCPEHDQDALGAAMDVSREISEIDVQSPLKIGINGCATCCTPCHTLDIAIIGEPSGYRISLGGKGSQVPEFATFMAEGVPEDKLPGLIRKVVELYRNKQENDESLLEVLDRCGVSDFVAALAPYSQDAAHIDDPLAAAAPETVVPPVVDEPVEAAAADDAKDLQADDLDDLSFDDLPAEEPVATNDDEPVTTTDSAGNSSMLAGEDDDVSLDDVAGLENDLAATGSLDDDLSPADESMAASGELPDEDVALGDLAEDELEEIPIDESPGMNHEDFADSESSAVERSAAAFEQDQELDNLDDDLTDIDDAGEDLHELSQDSAEDLTDEERALLTAEDDDLNPPAPAASGEGGVAKDDLGEMDQSDEFEDFSELTEEDESEFEQKLNESIDEEAKLIASEEPDPNEGYRDEALGMLAGGSADDAAPESATAVADDEIEDYTDLDESDEVGMETELDADTDVEADAAPVDFPDDDLDQVDQPLPFEPREQKAAGSPVAGSQKQFSFAGLDWSDGNQVHLSFHSGASMDLNLSSLSEGEEKSFAIGGQKFVFARTPDGFIVEVQGMRLFYPAKDLSAAS